MRVGVVDRAQQAELGAVAEQPVREVRVDRLRLALEELLEGRLRVELAPAYRTMSTPRDATECTPR